MRVNVFLSILFFFIKFTSVAQSLYSFANDENYKQHKPELIKLLKKRINQHYDFQLRFWFHNNYSSIIFKDYLFIMEYLKYLGCISQNFTFIHNHSSKIKIEEKAMGFLNCDSIMQQLTSDSLFYLKSYSGNDILEEGLKRGLGLHYISEGGIDYTVKCFLLQQKEVSALIAPPSVILF